MKLYPVLAPPPQGASLLKGPALVAALREAAHTAVLHSAHLAGLPLTLLQQDEQGVPVPSQGTHWSLSHKPTLTAGVASDQPVGIDIEFIEPRREELLAYIARPEEWALFSARDWPVFFRIWTAKEAVLKCTRVGMAGVKECPVTTVDTEDLLTLRFHGRNYAVRQYRHNNHIASITAPAGFTVDWRTLPI